ncbi:hypothetical protein TNCV_3603581 [Trichonephila clavipes]|nr:hypothetical protein TNCV_3603581 [Trichonephila clavipes]
MGPDFNPWRVGYPERGNIIGITQYCTIPGIKGAIASRRLDFYLLVHGRYFISLLSPIIGNQWRRSRIRHLGTRPLGVTESPEDVNSLKRKEIKQMPIRYSEDCHGLYNTIPLKAVTTTVMSNPRANFRLKQQNAGEVNDFDKKKIV